MFGDVWAWAGERRPREANIGVDPVDIVPRMRNLFDDVLYWHEHGTYATDERAVRLHHRLVSIHPYRNGNGRHSRLLADSHMRAVGHTRLSWGGDLLVENSDLRRQYIAALRDADRENLGPLLDFATS